MVIGSTRIESFLKSLGFSLILSLLWGSFTILGARTLLDRFEFTELLWVVYNATISLLFLIRSRPSVVDMNPVHWIVALLTSFSGYALARENANGNAVLLSAGEALVVSAIPLGICAAIILGRSYDFLPALRRVRTKWLYQMVRHPMYLSSLAAELGYVLMHPSITNSLLLAVIAILYDRRAEYEEHVMSQDASYLAYLQRVKYRFIPGVY
jgi:protein-S-isoprenylcysteine O-methyltransferase Ste14